MVWPAVIAQTCCTLRGWVLLETESILSTKVIPAGVGTLHRMSSYTVAGNPARWAAAIVATCYKQRKLLVLRDLCEMPVVSAGLNQLWLRSYIESVATINACSRCLFRPKLMTSWLISFYASWSPTQLVQLDCNQQIENTAHLMFAVTTVCMEFEQHIADLALNDVLNELKTESTMQMAPFIYPEMRAWSFVCFASCVMSKLALYVGGRRCVTPRGASYLLPRYHARRVASWTERSRIDAQRISTTEDANPIMSKAVSCIDGAKARSVNASKILDPSPPPVNIAKSEVDSTRTIL